MENEHIDIVINVGDLVLYKGTIMYYAGLAHKQKRGDGPWEQMCLLCPVSPVTLKPDKRILKSRAFKFRYTYPIMDIELYKVNK